MKLLLLNLPLLILSVGCAHISATKTTDTLDTTTGKVIVRTTTKGGGTFFLAKADATKLVLGKETKTTSQLFGADNATTSGDVEMLKALSASINDLLVKAAAAATK